MRNLFRWCMNWVRHGKSGRPEEPGSRYRFVSGRLAHEIRNVHRSVDPNDDGSDGPLTRIGTNLEGVPIYSGRVPTRTLWDAPNRFGCFISLLLVEAIVFQSWPRTAGVLVAMTLIGLGVNFMNGVWESAVAKRFSGLVSATEAAERTGTTDLVIVTAARANGIKPRCIVNGIEHYAATDLPEDAMLLLRPASHDACLLRTPSPVEDDVLVRPANGK